MINSHMTTWRRSSVIVSILSVVLLFGCATPIEIKTASQAQLQLIEELEDAVEALKVGLGEFHEDKEALTRQEGEVLVAQQAIDVALEKNRSELTADKLFATYKEEVGQCIRSNLDSLPPDCQDPDTIEIVRIIQGDIESEEKAREEVDQILEVFLAQLALMKTAATTINYWLLIDVTISQEQADALAEVFKEAAGRLQQGGSS